MKSEIISVVIDASNRRV